MALLIFRLNRLYLSQLNQSAVKDLQGRVTYNIFSGNYENGNKKDREKEEKKRERNKKRAGGGKSLGSFENNGPSY